jgi:hypothetical protein
MEKSNLIPFVRENLDILFVGLNPATGSSRNRHYFSVKQSLWDQLYDAGLITSRIDKSNADEVVFGSTVMNFQGWSFGITDLITTIAESDSHKISPTREKCEELRNTILNMKPRVAILLHGEVVKRFMRFLYRPVPRANSGQLGKLISGCPTMFFNIAFPHGNPLTSESKVIQYEKVKQYLVNQ